MDILKVSFISAIETIIKLFSGLVVLKVLAIYTGPEGVAKFGQFQNFLTIAIVIVSGGVVTGLVKYVSKENTTANKSFNCIEYVRGALSFGFISTLILLMILFIYSDSIIFYIFGNSEYIFILYMMPIVLFFVVLYQVSVAYFNGVRKIRKMITIKIASSLSLLMVGPILIMQFGLYGGLIGLMSMQFVGGMVAIKLISAEMGSSWNWFRPKFDKKIQFDLGSYWVMSIFSLISTALVMILIRNYIVNEEGWEVAGLWEAVWKLSELSLLLVTTALSVYYVPKLSITNLYKDQLSLLSKVTMLAIILTISISLFIYILQDLIVVMIFSEDFLSVTEILKYQLIGGVGKIIGWVVGFHLLVKSSPYIYILVELTFGVIFYFLSVFLFDYYGLLGLTYAFLINSLLFLLFSVGYLKIYFYRLDKELCIAS